MKSVYIFICSLLFFACSSNDTNSSEDEWSVNRDDVSGVFSLFPLALNPNFVSVNEVDLADNVLVGVVNFGSEIRVYPYSFTYQNEIVNDEYGSFKYAISFCPLTKSGIAFERNQTFRASGYLYKENLTPWDEETETIWSQMLLKGIHGPLKDRRLSTIPVLETTWKTVKEHYSSAKTITNLASRVRPPEFPTDSTDTGNLPEYGERPLGIFEGFNKIHIFKQSDFHESNAIKISIGSEKYIVYGNSSKNIITAFKVDNHQNYSALEAEDFPFIIGRGSTIKYDIFGRGNNGIQLERPKNAYRALWWAWDDFYDNFEFQ